MQNTRVPKGRHPKRELDAFPDLADRQVGRKAKRKTSSNFRSSKNAVTILLQYQHDRSTQ